MKTALMLLPTLLLGACTGGGVCAEGDSCNCSGAGLCTWECPDGGCDYEANGVGEADLGCDGGNCTLDVGALASGQVTLSCDGGGCSVTAAGSGQCILSCSGNDCDMTCSGSGQCILRDCTSGCELECTTVTATCTEE